MPGVSILERGTTNGTTSDADGNFSLSLRSADAILSATMAAQPDLVVLGASVAGFSTFNDPHLLAMLDQLNCPVVIARDFTIPGMHRARSLIMRMLRK